MLATKQKIQPRFSEDNLPQIELVGDYFETKSKAAALSFVLFVNRCVLNWFGDWGLSALFQVGREFTLKMDLERPAWKQPDFLHFKVRRVSKLVFTQGSLEGALNALR